jgi:hypothetical protein
MAAIDTSKLQLNGTVGVFKSTSARDTMLAWHGTTDRVYGAEIGKLHWITHPIAAN